MSRPTEVSVRLTVPFFGEIGGVWKPDDAQRQAAWELYVELVTRVAVIELGPDEGVLREALTSFYSLFQTTRDILKRYGAAVAPRHSQGELTFGVLAVTILNTALRPLLTKWHPDLAAHEALRPNGVSAKQHERAWEHEPELRAAIRDTRHTLEDLARILAEVAGSADLLAPPPAPPAPSKSAGGGVASEGGSAR